MPLIIIPTIAANKSTFMVVIKILTAEYFALEQRFVPIQIQYMVQNEKSKKDCPEPFVQAVSCNVVCHLRKK